MTRVQIEYEQVGLGGGNGRKYVVEARAGGKFSSGDRTIEASFVDAVASAAVANLYPSDGMSSCHSHTDDSQRFHITLEGRRTIELFSTSHCTRNAPWNVVRNGELSVQYDGSVAPPLYALLAIIDPEHWRPSPPDDLRDVRILLGGTPRDGRGAPPAGVKHAPSRAAACARSAETSVDVRRALGGTVTIASLWIGCNARRDPACHRTEAQARMTWRGVTLVLRFDCVDDAVEPASVAAALATVRPLVDSKVFAAWLAVADRPGTLEPDVPSEWLLRSVLAPELRYHTQTRTIDVNAQHEAADRAFWTALGIDPSTRVYEGPEHFQSSRAQLDLAGHLLP